MTEEEQEEIRKTNEEFGDNLKRLSEETYNLGIDHTSLKNLKTHYNDKTDQFRVLIYTYMLFIQKNLLKSVVEALERVSRDLQAEIMQQLTGDRIPEQMGRRQGVINFRKKLLDNLKELEQNIANK